MLKDTFFTINHLADSENSRTCHITLNSSHPIFPAHFAGNPIMPGACVVQIIKELSADCFDSDFFVSAVKNMKFLQGINPLETPDISVQLSFKQQDSEMLSVAAVLKNGDKIFTKSTLSLKKVEVQQS